ncbi:hypothetical protein SAMN04515659_3198 [Dyella sp. 333MFSha]|nr:hypothetical protein SAMN04515659_3198 [Dyella sp. 333MFSha]
MDHRSPPARRPLLRRLRDRFGARGTVHLDRESQVIVHCPARFHATELALEQVTRVEAGNRDDGSFETVFLYFHAEGVPPLAVSEKDRGFAELVRDLGRAFPGIEDWQAAVPPVAFQLTSVDLWKREEPQAPEDPAVDHVA